MMALMIKHLERNKITMNYNLHEKPVTVETYLKFDIRFNKLNTSHEINDSEHDELMNGINHTVTRKCLHN